jgi:hypothetical protein
MLDSVVMNGICMVLVQFLLQDYGNDLSRKLNEVVNEIRRQRCSYLRYGFYVLILKNDIIVYDGLWFFLQ